LDTKVTTVKSSTVLDVKGIQGATHW